jgi:hypothetical protein
LPVTSSHDTMAKDTDEDTMVKAMRCKAEANLDPPGIISSTKSILSLATPVILAKLNNIGVSLDNSFDAILVSTKVLKHMKFDRLRCSPTVLRRSSPSLIDDDKEVYAISDGQLLTHLVGDVLEMGLDETLLGSCYEVQASDQKSRSSSLKLKCNACSNKKAKTSKSSMISK